MTNEPCRHQITRFFRHTFVNGGGYHIAEHCLGCGVNVRGPGVWVPRSSVKDDPDTLEEWPPKSVEASA